MMRTTLLPALTLSALLAAPAAAETRGTNTSEACAAAEAAFEFAVAYGGDARLFSDAFPRETHQRMVAAIKRGVGAFAGSAPSDPVQSSFERSPPGSALQCPNLRRRATEAGKLVTDVTGRQELSRLGLGKTTFLWRISLPVLNRNGKQAVAAVEAGSNQLAGGSTLLTLERGADGRWRVVGQRTLSLS